MFRFSGNESAETSRWDLREIARQMTLATNIYVAPDEVIEMPEYFYDKPVIKKDSGEFIHDEGVTIPIDDTACFYAQTMKTTLLCRVTSSENQCSYAVQKIDW